MPNPKQASPERQAQLLGAGARAAKYFTSILALEDLLNYAVDTIVTEYGFYYAGIFLLDSTQKSAILKAGYGDAGKTMLAESHQLEVGGNSMIGDAIAQKTARISLDVGDEAVFFKNPHLPETRSEMGLPLIIDSKPIGALTVQSKEEAAFTQEDIESMQMMADLLAIAINNAQLHQATQKRASYFQAANTVGHNLATILDLDVLLPKTVDVIVDAYDFYYAGVFLIDENKKLAVLRAGYGTAGEAMMAVNHQLEIGGNSMIGDAIATQSARISLDVGEEAVFFKNPHLPQTRSEMALPLVIGDEVLGALTIQSQFENAFTEEDISTLQTMADHLAIALKNAQTLQALEKAHSEILRQKTFEALATATTQAIHWIGNKALPITTTVARLNQDLEGNILDLESFREDLEIIDTSAQLIIKVKEALIGPARESAPRSVMIGDIANAAATYLPIVGQEFSITLSGDDRVIGDSTQLVRVFENLYKNAIEAKATEIKVEIENSNDLVNINISDNGEGIPGEMLNKIWASFITTKGPNYTGIGLPAVLHVLGQHQGTIEVSNTSASGTTFTITLPADQSPQTQTATFNKKHILLLAEPSNWTKFVIDTFSSSPVTINCQSELTDDNIADIIWLDDTSVEISDLLQQISEQGLNQKTIVLATAVQVERTTSYLEHKIKDVCLKPYSPTELEEILSIN